MLAEEAKSKYMAIASDSAFAANVCAFLNGDGGNILADATVHVEELIASITPNAPVFYRKEASGECWVDVPRGNDKPYSFDTSSNLTTNSSLVKLRLSLICV